VEQFESLPASFNTTHSGGRAG